MFNNIKSIGKIMYEVSKQDYSKIDKELDNGMRIVGDNDNHTISLTKELRINGLVYKKTIISYDGDYINRRIIGKSIINAYRKIS